MGNEKKSAKGVQQDLRASIGRRIARFSVVFVAVVSFFPFIILSRELMRRGKYSISFWWLKSLDVNREMWKKQLYRSVRSRKGSGQRLSTYAIHAAELHRIRLSGAKMRTENDKVTEQIAFTKSQTNWARTQQTLWRSYQDNLAKGAFCTSSMVVSPLFHYYTVISDSWEPWIWDASLGEDGAVVNILIADKDLLQSITLSRFDGGNGTGTGLSSSTSSQLHTNPQSNKVHLNINNHVNKLRPNRLVCRFYDHENVYLASLESLKVLWGYLIRCPVPFHLRTRDRLRVKLQLTAGVAASLPTVVHTHTRFHTHTSSSFHSLLSRGFATVTSPEKFVYPICPLASEVIPSSNVEDRFVDGIRGAIGREGLLRGSPTKGLNKPQSDKRAALSGPAIFASRPKDGSAASDNTVIHKYQGAVDKSIDPPVVSPDVTSRIYVAEKQEPLQGNEGYQESSLGSDSIGDENGDDAAHDYMLSVCAATSRGHRKSHKALLIEWIEFHRLLGVQHFFLYDTYMHVESSDNEVTHDGAATTPSSSSGSAGTTKRNNDNINNSSSVFSLDSIKNKIFWKLSATQQDTLQADNADESNKMDSQSDAQEDGPVAEDDDDDDHYNDDRSADKINSRDEQTSLSQLLAEYISLGMVTVVPWPYIGCDGSRLVRDDLLSVNNDSPFHSNATATGKKKKGASNDSSASNDISRGCRRRLRLDPPPLRRTAQLSCYLRFRSSSKWMALLGPDEFIGIDISRRFEGHMFDDIPSLLESLDKTHKNLAVVELQPMPMFPCPSTSTSIDGAVSASGGRRSSVRSFSASQEGGSHKPASAEVGSLGGFEMQHRVLAAVNDTDTTPPTSTSTGIDISESLPTTTVISKDTTTIADNSPQRSSPSSPTTSSSPIAASHSTSSKDTMTTSAQKMPTVSEKDRQPQFLPDKKVLFDLTQQGIYKAADEELNIVSPRVGSYAFTLQLQPSAVPAARRLIVKTDSVVAWSPEDNREVLVELRPPKTRSHAEGEDNRSNNGKQAPSGSATKGGKQYVRFSSNERADPSQSQSQSRQHSSSRAHGSIFDENDTQEQLRHQHVEAKRGIGRDVSDQEYSVATLDTAVAAVLHYRVIPDSSNDIQAANTAQDNSTDHRNDCNTFARLAAFDVADLPLLIADDRSSAAPAWQQDMVATKGDLRLHSTPLSELCPPIWSQNGLSKERNEASQRNDISLHTSFAVPANAQLTDHILLLLGDRFLRGMEARGGIVAQGFGRKEVIEGDSGDVMVYY